MFAVNQLNLPNVSAVVFDAPRVAPESVDHDDRIS